MKEILRRYTDRAGDEVSDTHMCKACCNPMEGCHSLSLDMTRDSFSVVGGGMWQVQGRVCR